MTSDSEMPIFSQLQHEFCGERDVACMLSQPEDIIGLAVSTLTLPIANGLRYPANKGTTGWYVWFGEVFSERADFFTPVHARHLYDDRPDLIRLFGLPPGFRFLLTGEYLDVWFDEKLLITEGNAS